jgi:ankyrin repeat protein
LDLGTLVKESSFSDFFKLPKLNSLSLSYYDASDKDVLPFFSGLQPLDVVFKSGLTLLHLAARAGHLELVERMCKELAYPGKLYQAKNIWIHLEDIDGNTAIKYAVDNNHDDVAKVLLAHGQNA